ncbi:type II toxin-antitoxin system Phd/YefM family antitoxin [Amedibacterium intestinale]|uniref:Antitoxin n=1 Tax=Amedibacterium intestinale TaxID=2583452 RepID=A0A6N4TIH8_9FIRM|nr:type II toxin-antitoxin system Phd/YefM family antitoxin [Amedibacterium intestinale]RHO19710.1 type II toxin-antitoxin system Phd/YefM family antitoxin [Eubacterium sp. AM18-26]RHO23014.1 type II toxin-antitoxin system Phd/YefM family antitoxin [Eubacterium sp. AM18-10LB-B]BBK22658.1 hypothetical protein Aargi30884_15610 [Amedibacterium intestinale]
MNINSNMLEVILNSTISISELTKAGAKKIFDGLSKDNSKIVLRNNKPVAALISPDRYQDLLEKEEDLQLLEMALARQGKDSALTTREDFLKEMGIDDKSLLELPEIEME